MPQFELRLQQGTANSTFERNVICIGAGMLAFVVPETRSAAGILEKKERCSDF